MNEHFDFVPAVREQVHLLIGLAGASGSGKTKSALELAVGLANGDENKIGMIDTEARRGLHYARTPGATATQEPDKYGFLHSDMLPPFRPARFEDGIRAAEAAGLDVLIIDSFSHEYDGDGGIMDWANELESGIAKPGIEHPRDPWDGDGWKDWQSKPVKPPAQWKEPKASHKHLVQVTALQARCHLIFCMRAEEKIRIVNKGDPLPDGSRAPKLTIVQAGWSPICEKRFMYEMTLSFTLRPDQPGVPQFNLPHKIQDQHLPFFPEGQRIGRESGRLLAEWAAGGKIKAVAGRALNAEEYLRRIDHAASRAADAEELSTWWKSDSEKSKREAAGLSREELRACQATITARINTLKGMPADA